MRGFRLASQLTITLSAFLLFLLEPLIAKQILPWFGGSAAVWTVCLVFFQSALLAGYYYADLTTRRLQPRAQTALHVALLAVCLLFLPIAPGSYWKSSTALDPTWRIIGLLTTTIGIPFVVLSATSSLIQARWKAAQPDREPYFLFALSNAASLLALLAYPFLIEPHMGNALQAKEWSVLFVVFAVACGAALLLSFPKTTPLPPVVPVAESRVSWALRLRWLALPAGSSMLLLTVTSHLTQNVSPVPLLWVLPLALYLLTFTLAFSGTRFYRRTPMAALAAVSLCAMGYALYDPSIVNSVQASVALFCSGLFCSCLFCHDELSTSRGNSAALTSFYLTVSLGGALGALAIGILAPVVFVSLYEFAFVLLLLAVLGLSLLWQHGWIPRAAWGLLALLLTYVLVNRIVGLRREATYMTRNFYGALRVTEFRNAKHGPARSLYHGAVRHGTQFLEAPWNRVPVTYYSFQSGIGLALQFCCAAKSKRVGVIGLGTGTLAAYGRPGDYFSFYDIDPHIVTIAQRFFTYLRDSPAHSEIKLGDARLTLESEPPQNFDVLAVDAFSGDAIPVHLLTEEGLNVYLRHLTPDGVIAIHTSNSYLLLEGLVKRVADRLNLCSRLVESEADEDLAVTYSDWVLVSRNARLLDSNLLRQRETPINVPSGVRAWTDDGNNLFSILKPFRWSGSDDE